jgi:glutamate/tyrosine decarboxylase-like PLP-dependent enzyme
MAPPSLSVVCFRYAPANLGRAALEDVNALNALNRALLERLQLSGRAFLSSTMLNGRFVLRACIVNPLSAQSDIDVLCEAVKAFGIGPETCDNLRSPGS